MFKKINVFLILIVLFCIQNGIAQVNLKKTDTTKMYSKIEKFSTKRKFTRFIYKLIFEPTAKEPIVKHKKKYKKKNSVYAPYECKIIRNINIVTLDPFGFSEVDTLKKPKLYRDKLGNSLHARTKKFTIANLLLYKKNSELDSLLIKESERLIRGQDYVKGVQTTVKLVSKANDSVDITIRVLDLWSIIPDFNTSNTTSTFRINEKNVLGLGHDFSNTYRKSLTTNKSAFSSSYSIPNIFKTYIKTTLNYDLDVDGKYVKYVNFERPFFSAYTRWAGGVYLDQNFKKVLMADAQQVQHEETFKSNLQDFWLGRSFRIFKGKTEQNRATNLVAIARYLNRNYLEKPEFQFDSLRYFSNEKFYLASIGLSSRKFTQEEYLFKFNVTEDVASGYIYDLIGGYQQKNNTNRYYFGGRFAIGKYFSFGYLSSNLECGSFFNKNITEQTAFVGNLTYFTNLIEIGNWTFREFIKPQIVIGNNRQNTAYDQLNLNGINGIQGFTTTPLTGTKKCIINFQTQGYSPWNIIGFRLNPYFSYTMGMLGTKNEGFKNSHIYSQIGLGMIVSNDYLIFNSFQISFSFYPNIPGYGEDVLKTNSFKTTDFGLQNFDISKPSSVPYQ